MIKKSISLQDLRKKIYIKAKAEKTWRFWGIYVHVCKMETLKDAYRLSKQNNGAPGIDGVTFDAIESEGVEEFLHKIQQELITKTYYPMRTLKKVIPKSSGKGERELGIPAIRDRIVQGSLKLILEPIFEADFQPGSYGYRPKRTAAEAVERVAAAAIKGKTRVIDVDLKSYFDTVRHDILFTKVASRVNDNDIMRLLKLILKASGKRGVSQGGPISPLLSNIYLNKIDQMLEKAKEVTTRGIYQHIEYCRWADDLIILINDHPKWHWLESAVYKRLLEELKKLGVELNLEKTKNIDMRKGETVTFLGFVFKRIRTRQGKWGVSRTPSMKSRTNLMHKVKEIARRYRSQPIGRIIYFINPILRGWVNYFRIGNSTRCFDSIKDWVEKKLRRHLMHARKRKGFGWKRWSRQMFYQTLGLYSDYKIRYYQPLKVSPA